MDDNHWKHLVAAAKSVGSALNLSVEVEQGDEDYPELVIAKGVSIFYSEADGWKGWTVTEIVTVPDTREEQGYSDYREVAKYLPSHWHKALKLAFKRVTEEIITSVIDAEGMAEDFEAAAGEPVKLRKVK